MGTINDGFKYPLKVSTGLLYKVWYVDSTRSIIAVQNHNLNEFSIILFADVLQNNSKSSQNQYIFRILI